jgi:hypothetical protein
LALCTWGRQQETSQAARRSRRPPPRSASASASARGPPCTLCRRGPADAAGVRDAEVRAVLQNSTSARPSYTDVRACAAEPRAVAHAPRGRGRSARRRSARSCSTAPTRARKRRRGASVAHSAPCPRRSAGAGAGRAPRNATPYSRASGGAPPRRARPRSAPRRGRRAAPRRCRSSCDCARHGRGTARSPADRGCRADRSRPPAARGWRRSSARLATRSRQLPGGGPALPEYAWTCGRRSAVICTEANDSRMICCSSVQRRLWRQTAPHFRSWD